MKWTKEKDCELALLISTGKRYYEISEILKTSIRSITNRCFRLGLKIVYHLEKKCKSCSKNYSSLIKTNRDFCSRSCAASYTNKIRGVRSAETKERISKANKQAWLKKDRPKKIIKTRSCRNCGANVINRKLICDECRFKYYDFYRPSCEFTFNIKDYKNEFDLKLVEEYGWYSPSNKGNNLDGVSRDHLYSVRDGFINNIKPELIKHPANCRLMIHKDNNTKHYNSSITLDELLEKINNWDNKIN